MKIVLIGVTTFCYLTSVALGKSTCNEYNKNKDKCVETEGCQLFGDKIVPKNKCAPKDNFPTEQEKETECLKWTNRQCDAKDPIDGRRVLQAGKWKGSGFCSISEPGDVTNFKVECKNATYLDFSIADCCVDGDHWQLKGKQWDRAPNTAVTTSPGQANNFGVDGRIYNYDGTPEKKKSMYTLIECSYLHGTALFGAGSFVRFGSDGICKITKVPVVERIDRSP